MTLPAILLPVFVHVLLVAFLAGLMGRRRLAVARAGEVRTDDVMLGQKTWPAKAQAAANAYSNQFELPILFYALVPLAILTRKADLAFVVMSWLFVASRVVHAAVYVTTNKLAHRMPSFLVGAAVLFVMWIVFALRILSGPLPA